MAKQQVTDEDYIELAWYIKEIDRQVKSLKEIERDILEYYWTDRNKLRQWEFRRKERFLNRRDINYINNPEQYKNGKKIQQYKLIKNR